MVVVVTSTEQLGNQDELFHFLVRVKRKGSSESLLDVKLLEVCQSFTIVM